MTGKVAMAIDGEWRGGMVDDSDSKVDYGVAPFPVPDDQADQYGKGYITGTIVGIARPARSRTPPGSSSGTSRPTPTRS